MFIDSEMSKQNYSILIVGINCHPTHIIRFIRNLKLVNPSVKISFMTNREPSVYPEEVHCVIDEFIKWRLSSRCGKIPFINELINHFSSLFQIHSLAKKRRYDIIDIHFPQYYFSYLMRHMRKMSKSIVISPWGSDVLRLEGKRKRRQLAKVFLKADYITVGTKGDIGETLINEMRVNQSKFHSLTWGSETIDYINEHLQSVSTSDAKKKLGLEDRYVITCGYNAFEEQRHLQMISAIEKIKTQLPTNLVLLFPVTYGYSYGTRKQEYVEILRKKCQDSGIDAVFYENYLSVADLFYLRQGTDMFIHIQITDGGNSSLQEYVLCRKKVVHGSWIHYDYLEKFKPLFYFPVNDLNHLSEAILKAYYSDPIETPAEVLSFIHNRGWKAKMASWDSFFRSIC